MGAGSGNQKFGGAKWLSPITDDISKGKITSDPMQSGGRWTWLNPIYAGGKYYMNQEEKKAEEKLKAADQRESAAAAKMDLQLRSQPKKVAPDNYLSDRARRLATLRLGLSSTMTSSRGSQTPALSVPTLSAVPTKKGLLGY